MRTLASSFKRACERHGRAVVLVPDSVSARGPEALLTGNEEGKVNARGFFHDPERGEKPPEGELSVLRMAYTQCGESYDWLFRTAAAYFAAEPTESWRLVDGAKTYAVVKVRPRYRRQTAVAYELLLRLI